jgi:hypothetical protein
VRRASNPMGGISWPTVEWLLPMAVTSDRHGVDVRPGRLAVVSRSAPAHGSSPERAQLSVAELLGRDARGGGARVGGAGRDPASRGHSPGAEPVEVPDSWPLPIGRSRLRLARTAGAYVVAGSVVCAAAFGGHMSEGPTMGTETIDGGPPPGERIVAPGPVTPVRPLRSTGSDRSITPKARRIPPASRTGAAVPRPARRISPPRRAEPTAHRHDGPRVPAASTLRGLTRPLIGSDLVGSGTLLGGLG